MGLAVLILGPDLSIIMDTSAKETKGMMATGDGLGDHCPHACINCRDYGGNSINFGTYKLKHYVIVYRTTLQTMQDLLINNAN